MKKEIIEAAVEQVQKGGLDQVDKQFRKGVGFALKWLDDSGYIPATLGTTEAPVAISMKAEAQQLQQDLESLVIRTSRLADKNKTTPEEYITLMRLLNNLAAAEGQCSRLLNLTEHRS